MIDCIISCNILFRENALEFRHFFFTKLQVDDLKVVHEYSRVSLLIRRAIKNGEGKTGKELGRWWKNARRKVAEGFLQLREF